MVHIYVCMCLEKSVENTNKSISTAAHSQALLPVNWFFFHVLLLPIILVGATNLLSVLLVESLRFKTRWFISLEDIDFFGHPLHCSSKEREKKTP